MKNKDVIYIDVDDDITSVIGKVKNAQSSLVALVTPKRSSVFQSIVNLKLLQRKAETASKKLVLVTSDRSTVALAGSLGLYVAKNLQTKPEIPTVGAVLAAASDEVEAIEAPVEDTKADKSNNITGKDLAMAAGVIAINDNSSDVSAASGEAAKKSKKSAKSKKNKVPNFDGFRKKAFLIAGGAALLVVALVAFFTLTGKTTVVIHGETSSVDVAFDLKVDANAEKSSPKDNIIKAESQELQKSVSETFTATGQKNVGEKASGTVTVSNCQTPTTLNIPAGTTFTSSNGLKFTSTASGSAPGAQGNFITGCTAAGVSDPIPVKATSNGGKYNLSPQDYQSGLGSQVTTEGSQMSGGTDKIVKIVTQSDVDGAKAKLQKQDKSAIQKELQGQFDKDLRVLPDTFIATAGQVSVTPNVGDQASQGTVTAQYTYTELAISNDDLNAELDYHVNDTIEDKSTQRIYKNGFDDLVLTPASKPTASSITYHAKTTAYVGPQFDEDSLKKQITGKKYGEIVSVLQQNKGVNSVDVHFSPFWSRSAGPPPRIQINLDVSKTNASGS